MDLQALQATLRQFAAERDWQPFHTPKNLAMALVIEAAELAEIFQWMTPEQSLAARGDAVTAERVGDEVADVLLYLLQIADHTGVDLKRAVGRKLSKNARKHPPLRPGQPAGPKPEAMIETHVLLDYENVQPTEAQLRAMVPDMTDLWLFHGLHQKNLAHRFASLGERLSLVQIDQRGKNALDFHLSFYLGYVAARHPDAHLVVVANDKGYEPMLGHAKRLGFAARQLGHVNAPKAAATKTARTTGRPAAKTAAAPAPAKKAAPARAAARKGAVKSSPEVQGVQARPARPARPARAAAPIPAAPAAKAVLATKHAAPAPKPATSLKRVAAKPAPSPREIAPTSAGARTQPARPRPPGHQAAAAKTPKPVKTAKATSRDDVAPAPASRLAEALHKMGARRPRKLLSLRRHLASFLGVALDGAQAQSALNELLARGALTVDDSGNVTYRL